MDPTLRAPEKKLIPTVNIAPAAKWPEGAKPNPAPGLAVSAFARDLDRGGYKVVFVPFEAGKPKGMPIEVLTGFVNDEGKARGRPVGATIVQRAACDVEPVTRHTVSPTSSATRSAPRLSVPGTGLRPI